MTRDWVTGFPPFRGGPFWYIDQEGPAKIVEKLRGANIDIARRTVAKYREQLGILSSSKRKRVF